MFMSLPFFLKIAAQPEIERILHDTGIESNPENRNDQTKVTTSVSLKSFKGYEKGGLAILAHVNSANGYREEMKCMEWDDDKIFQNICDLNVNAIEVSKPDDARHFIKGEKQLPCVIGSDAHYLKDIGGKEYITRVKMTEPELQ